MSSLLQYMRDTRAEMKNTNWPSPRQTTIYTALVIGISIAVALYLTIFDTASIYALNALI